MMLGSKVLYSNTTGGHIRLGRAAGDVITHGWIKSDLRPGEWVFAINIDEESGRMLVYTVTGLRQEIALCRLIVVEL